MSTEKVRRLLSSGEIKPCASDHDVVDGINAEAFRSARRERVGKSCRR